MSVPVKVFPSVLWKPFHSNVGGTNEIVTSESGVLLDPHFSAQELADQIVRVYEHKDRFHPRRLWEEKFNAGKNYPRFISQILND